MSEFLESSVAKEGLDQVEWLLMSALSVPRVMVFLPEKHQTLNPQPR